MKLKQINDLPESPGVYKFLDKNKKILYIGKASILRDRVRSYFSKDLIDARGIKIEQMVREARSIAFEKTDSVIEALILESALIKKFQPKYNSKEKDDKSFNFLIITEESFPRVLVVRGRDLQVREQVDSLPTRAPISKSFKKTWGPFTNATALKTALKIVRKIFPFRDKCEPNSKRACFYSSLRLCPGVCAGTITEQEYAKIIKNISLFFDGKKQSLIRLLKKEMLLASKDLRFEDAEKLRRQIFALSHIRDTALMNRDAPQKSERVEGYDISHLGEQNRVGVMVVIKNGMAEKSEYRTFNIKGAKGDTNALKEIISRRLKHSEWDLPELIVVDGGEQQLRVAVSEVVKSGKNIAVCSVVKDEMHKPKDILGIRKHFSKETILLANFEAHRFAIKTYRMKHRKLILKSCGY